MPTLRSAGEQLLRATEAAVGMERGRPAPTAGKEQSHTTAGRSQDANAFKMLQAPPEGPPAPEVSQGENMPHTAHSREGMSYAWNVSVGCGRDRRPQQQTE